MTKIDILHKHLILARKAVITDVVREWITPW